MKSTCLKRLMRRGTWLNPRQALRKLQIWKSSQIKKSRPFIDEDEVVAGVGDEGGLQSHDEGPWAQLPGGRHLHKGRRVVGLFQLPAGGGKSHGKIPRDQ